MATSPRVDAQRSNMTFKITFDVYKSRYKNVVQKKKKNIYNDKNK